SRTVEVVLDQIRFALGFGIFEVAVVAWLITVVVVAGFVGVDDRLPLTIETGGLTAVNVCDQTDLLRSYTGNSREQAQEKKQCFHHTRLINKPRDRTSANAQTRCRSKRPDAVKLRLLLHGTGRTRE